MVYELGGAPPLVINHLILFMVPSQIVTAVNGVYENPGLTLMYKEPNRNRDRPCRIQDWPDDMRISIHAQQTLPLPSSQNKTCFWSENTRIGSKNIKMEIR